MTREQEVIEKFLHKTSNNFYENSLTTYYYLKKQKLRKIKIKKSNTVTCDKRNRIDHNEGNAEIS